MLDQQRIDLFYLIYFLIQSNKKHRIARNAGIQRTHAVQPQNALCLLQRALCRKTNAQNIVALIGMLFAGQQAIAIPFGKSSPMKHLLLG